MPPTNNFLKITNSSDAVAEVLDFVMILGILMLSFSIIGLAGYPILRNAQEARYIENTKMSFVVMADNINRIALGQAPSQSVELKLYGGRLDVTREGWINITARNSTGTIIPLVSQSLGNIENSIGDTVIAYEGTGVWVKYPSDTVLNAYKPLVTNQSNVLVIPVVMISGNDSVGGNGMSRLRAEGEPDVKIYSNVSNITLRLTGNYAPGWNDYFKDVLKWEVQLNSTTLTGYLNNTNLDVYILNTHMITEVQI